MANDSATMKAWQCTEFGKNIEESLFLNNTAGRPRASIAPDEILVHVISAALNPVDYKLVEVSASKLMIKTPKSPGTDYCGRVVASGTAIDSVVNGAIVFGRVEPAAQFGTLGEYILTNLDQCVTLPEGIEIDHAAAIGTAGITAYQCIVPNVKSGDKVFINGGSGGTGLFGIQIAKILGCHVTVSCSSTNISLCKDYGADDVLDYKVSDISEKLKAGGMVYDLVVDNVGTPEDLYKASAFYLKQTGKFVQVGGSPSLQMMGSVLSRMLRPSFLGGGNRKYQFLNAKSNANDFEQIAKWMQAGKVKAVIDETYEMNDVIKAYERLKTGRARGKIVVHVSAK